MKKEKKWTYIKHWNKYRAVTMVPIAAIVQFSKGANLEFIIIYSCRTEYKAIFIVSVN